LFQPRILAPGVVRGRPDDVVDGEIAPRGPTSSRVAPDRLSKVDHLGLGRTGDAPFDDRWWVVSILVVNVDLHRRELAHAAHGLEPRDFCPWDGAGHGLQGVRVRVCRAGIRVAGRRAAASPRGMGAPADRGIFVEQTIKRLTAAGPHHSDSSQFGMSGLACQLDMGASSAVTLHLALRPVNGYRPAPPPSWAGSPNAVALRASVRHTEARSRGDSGHWYCLKYL